MRRRQFQVGQVVGGIILAATTIGPALSLAGFREKPTWSLLCWALTSVAGGFAAGLLIAPKHRLAGAIGGMIGAPFGMLALFLYAQGRPSLYRAEAVLVSLAGALPGAIVYFLLRLLTDALFPARDISDDFDDEEEDEGQARRRRRNDADRRRGDLEDV